MAGDLKVTAYLERSQIDRIVPFEKRSDLSMDRLYLDVDLKDLFQSNKIIDLKDGDDVHIFSILDMRKNIVNISGAITRPGNYDLGDSLKISELITKADGLVGDAYLDRIDVIRIKGDFTEQLIKLDLGKALEGNENDIKLNSLDRLVVYSMSEMIPKTYVSIKEKVKRPGRYLLQENMNLYDLIFKNGRIYR